MGGGENERMKDNGKRHCIGQLRERETRRSAIRKTKTGGRISALLIRLGCTDGSILADFELVIFAVSYTLVVLLYGTGEEANNRAISNRIDPRVDF